jgi:transcriptional regulator GlxA family with amidase domain
VGEAAASIIVGFLVFDDVEELDLAGPFEVFGTAAAEGAPCSSITVAERSGLVRARHGLRVMPDTIIAACPPLGVLIVPGGPGSRTVRDRPAVLEFARAQAGTVASVCTGALILASAGMLDGRRAATHHGALGLLRQHKLVNVDPAARFVLEGRIGTSAGVSAGIDLALALTARLWGNVLADRVARRIEWTRPAGP